MVHVLCVLSYASDRLSRVDTSPGPNVCSSDRKLLQVELPVSVTLDLSCTVQTSMLGSNKGHVWTCASFCQKAECLQLYQ